MLYRYYRLLDISSEAGLEEIKRAYRKKAKLYHPDLNLPSSSREKFIEITKAYEYFIERKKRSKYATYTNTKASYKKAKKKTQRGSRHPRDRATRYSKMKYTTYKKENTAFTDEHNFWKYRLLYYGMQVVVYTGLFAVFFFVLMAYLRSSNNVVLLGMVCLLIYIIIKVYQQFKLWKLDFKNVFSDQ